MRLHKNAGSSRVQRHNVHVNVVTAFRKILQSRREGLPSGVVERALQALEAAALRTIDAFEAQPVANILHIIAKTRYSPRDQSLVPQLEGRAEALAGTFNAQNVANTLWAYAKMGRKPGTGLLKALEGRAGTFNAQNVANTLWAYATMGREPGTGLMKELEGRGEAMAGTDRKSTRLNSSHRCKSRMPTACLPRSAR